MIDLAIIGGGPAGITAAIYASRNNLNTFIFGESIGGMLFNKAVNVENYLGFPSIAGFELASRFREQLEAQEKVTIVEEDIVEIKKEGDFFKLKTNSKEIVSRAVIIASGSRPRELQVKGEKEFLGKGVGYCPVCDGPFFKNKDIMIVGGGNASFESAIYLSSIVKSIVILERGERFIADVKNQERIKGFKNIKAFTNSKVLEVKGEKFLDTIIYEKGDDVLEEKFQGMFVQIGYVPKTEYVKDLVDLNNQREIIVNENMETKTEGLFAAGDIINSKVKQIICAASSGAVAALSAYNYLLDHE
ncbi:MAG: FAD-dependent oxidoreductase [Candidatus Pacebacteria bacterium]|nr:FAD-dependent oxidoreductase [Candidatus Paceibacterota bacterium]MDD3919108.1 FAD-dependent oxidoreductase [Candidatus Paceibacterota bacterium]